MNAFVPPDADEWLERLSLQVRWIDIPGFREAITPPVVLLGRRQSLRQQRWLTFHAIGHVQLHRGNQLVMLRSGRTSEIAKQERQAEMWAARLLVPSDPLMAAIYEGLSTEELSDLFDVPTSRLDYAIQMHGANMPVGNAEVRDAPPDLFHSERTTTRPSWPKDWQ